MMGLQQLFILTVAILCDVTKGQEEATLEDIERLGANITQLSNQFRLLQASIDERLASVGNSEVQQVRSLMHAAHIPHLSYAFHGRPAGICILHVYLFLWQLKDTIGQLSRQLLLAEMGVEERARSTGDSGLKQVRV